MPTATPILATGIKGFLLWLKQQQPGIYVRVAPQLPKLVPEAFTATNRQTMGRLRAIYKSGLAHRSPQRLGQYCAPITVDYTAALTQPITYESFAPTVSYASLSAPVCVGPICPGATPTLTCGATVNTGTDVANAANSGNASSGTTAAIAQAVNAVANTVLTAQEAATLASVISSQLKNAQSGLSPSPVNTGNLGIPTVETPTTSSSTSLLLLGLAGLAAWAVLS